MNFDRHALDPIKFGRWLWPGQTFYRQQEDLIYSAVDNVETFCVGSNESGKDFVLAFIVIWFFMTRHPCRVITTSADYGQLEGVLWGEIGRLIDTAKYNLRSEEGGPLVVNHMKIRKVIKNRVCATSYIDARVARKGEGMLGHHCGFAECCGIRTPQDGLPRTLLAGDEGSGIDDVTYERASTWAKRIVVVGNAWPCDNFFYRACKGGDVPLREGAA